MAQILVLCSRVPYPLTGGAKLRMFHTARLLATEHDVDILAVDEEPVADVHINALEQQFRNVFTFTFPKYQFYLNTFPGIISRRPLQTHYFSTKELHRWVERNVDNYDLLYCNHVRTTEYARGYDMPKVVDLVDAISRNYEAATADASGLWRLIYPVEAHRLRRYEQQMVDEFDRSFVVSEADHRHISDGKKDSTFSVLPNGVREEIVERGPSPTSPSGNPRIVFLGKMDYFPNEDAAVYFARDVFPQIRELLSKAEFIIVGTSPTERVEALGEEPGVTVTGFVDDPLDYLQDAHVVVAPMRHGAGLQNKILEAMGMGKPVVTTSLGLEGIDAEPGTHLLTADGADELATAVATLLNSERKRNDIGTAARALIEDVYTWKQVRPMILNEVTAALD